MSTVTPQLDDVYTRLKAFIKLVLGASVPVDQGIVNRVSTPVGGYVVMTVLFAPPLMTTLEYWDVTDPNATTMVYEQDTQLNIQIDCYGPNSSAWSKILATTLRSSFGYDQLAPVCTPLHADDARMLPLVNAESQYEERWMLTATLQYNPVVTLPQDFATTLDIDLINVDERYPPT